MKKLKLENFKIATLSDLQSIVGGLGDDDDVQTGPKVCINQSRDWVKEKDDGLVDSGSGYEGD